MEGKLTRGRCGSQEVQLKIQKNLQSSARFLCRQPANVCLLHFIPELIACPYAVLHDPRGDDRCFNRPFVLGGGSTMCQMEISPEVWHVLERGQLETCFRESRVGSSPASEEVESCVEAERKENWPVDPFVEIESPLPVCRVACPVVRGAQPLLVLQWLGREVGPRSIGIPVCEETIQLCDGRWKHLTISLGRNHWTLIPIVEMAWFPTFGVGVQGWAALHVLACSRLRCPAAAAAAVGPVWDVGCFLKGLRECALCAGCWKVPSITSELAGFHCACINNKIIAWGFYTAGLILAVVPC